MVRRKDFKLSFLPENLLKYFLKEAVKLLGWAKPDMFHHRSLHLVPHPLDAWDEVSALFGLSFVVDRL